MAHPVRWRDTLRFEVGPQVIRVAAAQVHVQIRHELLQAEPGTAPGSPKRVAERTAGRDACAIALEEWGAAGSLDVVAAAKGRPDAGRPIVVPEVGLHVSITHSHGQAFAAVSDAGPLGIDTEPLELTLGPSFDDEAFAPGELDGHAHLPLPAGVTPRLAAWTAKEAALKAWGVGLRAPLQQVGLQLSPMLLRGSGLWLATFGVPEAVQWRLGTPPSPLALTFLRREEHLLALAFPLPSAKTQPSRAEECPGPTEPDE